MLDAITSRRAHAGARASTILPPGALHDGPIISASAAPRADVLQAVPRSIVADNAAVTVRPGSNRRPGAGSSNRGPQGHGCAEGRRRRHRRCRKRRIWAMHRRFAERVRRLGGGAERDSDLGAHRKRPGIRCRRQLGAHVGGDTMNVAAIYFRNARFALRAARLARREGDVAERAGCVTEAFAHWHRAGRCVSRARAWRAHARAARTGGAS